MVNNTTAEAKPVENDITTKIELALDLHATIDLSDLLLKYIAMFSDLLTQKELIRRHIAMLDALFKHTTEGIVVVDKSPAIVVVNPKAKELFAIMTRI